MGDEERPDPMQAFYARRSAGASAEPPISNLSGPELYAEVRRRAGSPFRVRFGFTIAPWIWVVGALTQPENPSPLVVIPFGVCVVATIITYYAYMGGAGLMSSLASKAYWKVHTWAMILHSKDDLTATSWEKRASYIGIAGFLVAGLVGLLVLDQ